MTGRYLAAAGLVLAMALAAAWASWTPARATTFNPFFGPPDFYRLDPATPGSKSDVHARFNILPPSANFSDHFGGLITFEDADILIASGAAIPDGSYMGRLESVARLGLANEGCNTDVPTTFDLIDAGTNTTPRPFTNSGGMTVGSGGIPAAGDDAVTTFIYVHPLDPLGLKVGATPGTIAAGVNEIQVDSEQMLVVDVNTETNLYAVIRGWNGTTPAAHSAGAAVTRVGVIYPNGPATNLLANQGEDDGDLDNNGTAEHPELANGIPDGADVVPSFVRNSLDPNSNADDGGYVQPHARYMGVAFVANTLIVVLQFVIFDPGALAVFPNLDWATQAWGWPSVTLLQDPEAPPSDSGITDFCGFTSNTFLYGVTHDNACTDTLTTPPGLCTGTGAGFTLRLAVDGGGPCGPTTTGTNCAPCPAPPVTAPNECGHTRLTSPPTAQPMRFYQYAVSQRDYDNDGIENGLDPCPYHYNPEWNPYAPNAQSGSDGDADGLPTACDPNDFQADSDQDNDSTPDNTGWFNRHDNCPTTHNTAPVGPNPDGGGGTTPNTFQYDRDVPPGQTVPDGGPPSDDIGPACDNASNNCGPPQGCDPPAPGSLTPTGANGHYHAAYATQTVCIGEATSDCSFADDNDRDGVVNAGDTCINAANPPTLFPPALITMVIDGDTINVDDALGFSKGSPVVINSPLETLRYITAITGNTVDLHAPMSFAHEAGDPIAQVAFAQTMRDMNNDGFVDTGDIGLLTGVFGSRGGVPGSLPTGYQARYDINDGPQPNNFIDSGDIGKLTGAFGIACGPPL